MLCNILFRIIANYDFFLWFLPQGNWLTFPYRQFYTILYLHNWSSCSSVYHMFMFRWSSSKGFTWFKTLTHQYEYLRPLSICFDWTVNLTDFLSVMYFSLCKSSGSKSTPSQILFNFNCIYFTEMSTLKVFFYLCHLFGDLMCFKCVRK